MDEARHRAQQRARYEARPPARRHGARSRIPQREAGASRQGGRASRKGRNAPQAPWARAARWFLDLPGNRPLTWLLVVVNAIGSAWGFWWYHDQLAATPRWMWPVVPDSPTASTLFTVALILQLLGRRSTVLEAFAYLTMVKYGLWTVVVLGAYGNRTGLWDPEAVMLIASHAGMAIEAAIYQRAYPAARRAVLAAWAWAAFNDLVDYGAGLHPYLPGPEVAGLAWQAAVALTGLAGAFVYRHASDA